MMAKIDNRIRALAFSSPTNKRFADVPEAVKNPSDRAARMLTKVHVTGVNTYKREISLEVKRAGVRRIGTAIVRTSGNDGQLSISFTPLEWMRSRPTLLFIPVGPATSVVLPVFRDFTAVLQQTLTS